MAGETKTPTSFVEDLGNEQCLILAAMRNNKIGLSLLRAIPTDALLNQRHRQIWDLFRAMASRGEFYGRARMIRWASELAIPETTIAYLVELEDYKEGIQDLQKVVTTLHWDATRHAIYVNAIPELMAAVLSSTSGAEDILTATNRIQQAVTTRTGGLIRNAVDVHLQHRREIDRRIEQPNPVAGIGAEVYDDRIGTGYSRKKTSVVVATSSTGKSTFALNILRLLVEQGRKCAIFLWEPEEHDALDALISADVGIELHRIQTGRLSPGERVIVTQASARWSEAVRFLGNPKTYLEDRNPKKEPKNAEVLELVAATIADSGADFILYDLWDRGIPQRERITDVENAFIKTMEIHKRLGVHGMILHQINLEKVEGGRKPRRPTRADVKGAKILVEAADFVSGLHRPGIGADVPDDIMEQECWKLRGGAWPWLMTWTWEGQFARVSNPRVGNAVEGAEFNIEEM
jgi:replicative DNA helicase